MKKILSFFFLVCVFKCDAQTNQTAIGINALRNSALMGRMIGDTKLNTNNLGNSNTAIGGDTYMTPSNGNNNVAFGYQPSLWYTLGDMPHLHGDADTLFIEDTSIHFIKIGEQVFEIKRTVSLEPVSNWQLSRSGEIMIGGSGEVLYTIPKRTFKGN